MRLKAAAALTGLFCLLVLSLATAVEEGFCPTVMDLGTLKPGVRPAFVLFGDSLTQRSYEEGGWGASMTHHYARKVDLGLTIYPCLLQHKP